MFRSSMTRSASGVVGPFAPSAIRRTEAGMQVALSARIWFSSAAGIRISTGCYSQTSPGSTS